MKIILFEIIRQIIWQIAILGKVSQKNTEKSGDSPNWGRGGHPEPNSIFEKKVFQGPHMTILGHSKHVLHLVWSACGSP